MRQAGASRRLKLVDTRRPVVCAPSSDETLWIAWPPLGVDDMFQALFGALFSSLLPLLFQVLISVLFNGSSGEM